MLRNTQSFAIPVYTGVATTELASVLSIYFNCHSAAETSAATSELLQAWINPEAHSQINTMQVANMVFFAFNINTLINKVATLDFNGDLGINENSTERQIILSFFDSFGFDYPVEFIADALQSWICPDCDSDRAKKNMADAVCLVVELNKLVSALEIISSQIEKGGAICA